MSNYPTNVSDSQWQVIKVFLDNERKRKYDLREVINAILYVLKTGCQWRMLPGDFAKWQLVYYYYRKWVEAEVFDRILDKLRSKVRVGNGQCARATLGIIDSQSVRWGNVSNYQAFKFSLINSIYKGGFYGLLSFYGKQKQDICLFECPETACFVYWCISLSGFMERKFCGGTCQSRFAAKGQAKVCQCFFLPCPLLLAEPASSVRYCKYYTYCIYSATISKAPALTRGLLLFIVNLFFLFHGFFFCRG